MSGIQSDAEWTGYTSAFTPTVSKKISFRSLRSSGQGPQSKGAVDGAATGQIMASLEDRNFLGKTSISISGLQAMGGLFSANSKTDVQVRFKFLKQRMVMVGVGYGQTNWRFLGPFEFSFVLLSEGVYELTGNWKDLRSPISGTASKDRCVVERVLYRPKLDEWQTDAEWSGYTSAFTARTTAKLSFTSMPEPG